MARKPLPSVAVAERAARPDAGGGLRRLLLAALGAAVLTAVMSGCVIIKSNSSQQLEVIGKVKITTRFCASDTTASPNFNPGYNPQDPTCQQHVTGGNPNAGGNSAGDAVAMSAGTLQLMVAYRIPDGASAPSTIVTTEPGGGSAVTFTQNASYAAELQAQANSAAPAGMKWAAYVSGATSYSPSTGQYFTVAPEFTLSQFLGIVPFVGPFNYGVAVGFRPVSASFPATRAVECGPDVFALHDEDGQGGLAAEICADNPMKVDFATNSTQPTRDLAVFPGSGAAQAGTTAEVPFDLWYNGAALPAGHFNVSASTNVPGGTATPSITTLTPAAAPTVDDGHNNMTVSVTVPPGTSPGSYNVTVTATLSTNPSQVRSRTATLTVGEAFGFSPAPDVPSFGTVTLIGQAQTKNRTLSDFGVIDSPGSSDQGWNVTVVGDNTSGKSPVFKQYCPPSTGGCGAHPVGYVADGLTLSANSITLDTSGADWSGGTGAEPTFACNSGGCWVDSPTPFKIASAPNGGGTGLWNASGFSATSLTMSTPSTMRALPADETYHLDLVFTLNSGP